jgi:F0F1-type ATP synthase assembly protein I
MTPPKPDSAERGRAESHLGELLSLGLNLAAGLILFTLLGLYIDHRRGGGVFWTVCGMLLGVAYGVYEVWKILRALNAPEQDARGTRARTDKDKRPTSPET